MKKIKVCWGCVLLGSAGRHLCAAVPLDWQKGEVWKFYFQNDYTLRRLNTPRTYLLVGDGNGGKSK